MESVWRGLHNHFRFSLLLSVLLLLHSLPPAVVTFLSLEWDVLLLPAISGFLSCNTDSLCQPKALLQLLWHAWPLLKRVFPDPGVYHVRILRASCTRSVRMYSLGVPYKVNVKAERLGFSVCLNQCLHGT